MLWIPRNKNHGPSNSLSKDQRSILPSLSDSLLYRSAKAERSLKGTFFVSDVDFTNRSALAERKQKIIT